MSLSPSRAKCIRVGNGAGFWGDSVDAPIRLAESGGLDVLTLEYLAELTMAILAHIKSKNPNAGYVTDFPECLERLAPILAEQPSLAIVTNAGGLNVQACAERCAEMLTAAGLGEMSLGAVEGDDILREINDHLRDGITFNHLETGAPIDVVLQRIVSANAYLGAREIANALSAGPRVVITGRVADASLTLGPAAHRFGWGWDDWDKLAGASVAGHLIECGAQATGGLFEEWSELPDPAGIGYPIAEISETGDCEITKPESSGGRISLATISEQIVYEIDDPCRYRTPDVDVDLTTVTLHDRGGDRVAVAGATGREPSEFLKVSAVYRDGWTASGMLAVVGRNAEANARAAGRAVIERIKRAGYEPRSFLIECIGAGDVVPGSWRPSTPPFEVMLRVTARDPRKAVVERFCKEIAPLVTSGPAGIAGYAAGRPVARPAFGYWPTLIPRDRVNPRYTVKTCREILSGGEAL